MMPNWKNDVPQVPGVICERVADECVDGSSEQADGVQARAEPHELALQLGEPASRPPRSRSSPRRPLHWPLSGFR
eukprot:3279945-Rhodomonas_salina.1